MHQIDLEGVPKEFGFGYLDHCLSMAVLVASDKRTAFQHRLKNLLKLAEKAGLSLGTAMGAGKATIFNWEDVGVLGVALELSQIGIPPERVMQTLAKFEYEVLHALERAARAFAEKPATYSRLGTDSVIPEQVLIWMDPRVLTMAFGDDSFRTERLDVGTVDDFRRMLETMDFAITRFAVCNVTSLISRITMVTALSDISTPAALIGEAVKSALTAWEEVATDGQDGRS